jgi:hypothetical protein
MLLESMVPEEESEHETENPKAQLSAKSSKSTSGKDKRAGWFLTAVIIGVAFLIAVMLYASY